MIYYIIVVLLIGNLFTLEYMKELKEKLNNNISIKQYIGSYTIALVLYTLFCPIEIIFRLINIIKKRRITK